MESLECSMCSKTYTSKSVLNRHLREVHFIANFKSQKSTNIRCRENEECKSSFSTIQELRNHLADEHGLQQFQEYKNLHFTSIKEFKEWLEKEEKETSSQFLNRRGERENQSGMKYLYYICRRSGLYEPKKERKRCEKMLGSCKMGFYCTAEIKAEVQVTGRVRVLYFNKHYKHDTVLGRLTVPESERFPIAGKLLQGVPDSRIIHDIRGSVQDKIERETSIHEELLGTAHSQNCIDDYHGQIIKLLYSITAKLEENKQTDVNVAKAVCSHLSAANELLSLGQAPPAEFVETRRNVPSNAKLDKQKRFFSTKKKRPRKENLKKPDAHSV